MLQRVLSLALVVAALFTGSASRPTDSDATPQALYGLIADQSCTNATPHCGSDASVSYVDPALMTRITVSIDRYWHAAFNASHVTYASPNIVWYVGALEPVTTACGVASAEPAFYCAKDRTIYLDSSLLAQSSFEAGYGDVSVGVTIAHEWTHHIQNLLGMHRSLTPNQPGEFLPQYLELQADCGAGAWAWAVANNHQTDAWDAPLAMEFFGTLGDSSPTPLAADAHGTGAQRVAAFQAGLSAGHYAADCKLPLG